MSHTPGPWRVNDESDGVWVQTMTNDASVICDVVGRVWDSLADCSQITDQDLANARLIAAAPDLLEALRRSYCDEFHNGVLCSECRKEGKGCLRAEAFAKAEGQA